MSTVHLLIKGRVQGVFYRASAKERAETLRVKGWVKNTAEGDVEITATGSEGDLQRFVEWCKTGPKGAEVASVSVSPLEETPFQNFSIVRE